MWLLDRFRKPRAETSGTANPARWLVDWVRGGQESAAGIHVSPAIAERQAAVFACCQVLAQDVAKLPVVLYRRVGADGKARVDDHPVAQLLRGQPNPRQTSYEWRHQCEWTLALRANSYSWIERDGAGRPRALWPLHNDRVQPLESPDHSIFYDIRRRDSDPVARVPARDMLHLRENSADGIVGRSRVSLLRESIALAAVTEQHGARVFKNGAKVSGVLTTPGHFTDTAKTNVKDSFEKKFSGEGAYGTAILEEGVTFTQIGMTADDAQYLETRKFQRSEIAAAWRVPLHKIGDLERATFSNIEQQSIDYVVDTMLAILANWEERLEMALLTDAERAGGLFIKFSVDGLLRGDIKSRYAAYAIGRNWGWLSPNDVRRMEDMGPIDGGDEYLKPTNMTDLNASLDTLDAGTGGATA